MQINRSLIFWGVALVTAGIVALLIQSGAISGESARQAWRLWPILLVAIGVAVIASRTPFAALGVVLAGIVAGGLAGSLVAGVPDGLSVGCGGETTETVEADGSFTETGVVVLDLSCAELDVSTQDGADWSVTARHGRDEEPQISSDDGSLRVTAEGGGFPGFSESRQAWEVVLPTEPELSLEVASNAASSRLDLGDAAFSSLDIDANAGEIDLSLPGTNVGDLRVDANAGAITIRTDAATTVGGSVQMNAGSLEICAPDDLPIAITIEDENVTFSHNLDERGLERQGDTWSTTGADADVRLDIEGNAASFTLNPDGGCE